MTWSHDLKLRRAREHLYQLKRELERWDTEGYEITLEPASRPPNYEVKARIVQPASRQDAWPLLIGDVLQNARAALDHIAYALGDAGPNGFMDEMAAMNSGFPIVGDLDKQGYSGRGPDLFEDEAKRRLATVAPEAREVIKRLQPYYAGIVWSSESLWILHELARFDRHRFPQLTVVTTGTLEVDPERTRNVKIEALDIETGRFFPEWDEESGKEMPTTLATVTAHPAKPDRPMELHFKNALEVGLDIDTLPHSVVGSLEDASVEMTLAGITHGVRNALTRLAQFLPPEPPRSA